MTREVNYLKSNVTYIITSVVKLESDFGNIITNAMNVYEMVIDVRNFGYEISKYRPSVPHWEDTS